MFILFSRWGVSASAKIVELGLRARLDFIATVPRNPWSGSAGGVTKRNPGSICSGSMCKESNMGCVDARSTEILFRSEDVPNERDMTGLFPTPAGHVPYAPEEVERPLDP